MHKFPWKFNFQKVKKCCVLLHLFSQNSSGSDFADKVDLPGSPGLRPRPLRKASAKVGPPGLPGPLAVRQPPGAPTHLLADPAWPFLVSEGPLLGAPQPAFQPRCWCFRSGRRLAGLGAAGRDRVRRGGTVAATPELRTYAQRPAPLSGVPGDCPSHFDSWREGAASASQFRLAFRTFSFSFRR